MAPARTLAAQLAELENPVPIDFDPEDAYKDTEDARHDEASDASDEEARDGMQGREHYVAVGRSALRGKNAVVSDPKYRGTTSSRRAIFDDDGEESEEEVDELDDEDSNEGSGRGREGEDDDDDNDEEGIPLDQMLDGSDDDIVDEDGSIASEEVDGIASGGDGEGYGEVDEDEEDRDVGDEEDRDGDEEITSESDEEDEEQSGASARPPTTASAKGKPKGKAGREPQDEEAEEKEMMERIRRLASEEAEKGKAVKKQLAVWDTLLDLRIRLQKAAVSSNDLPPPSTFPSFTSDVVSTAGAAGSTPEELLHEAIKECDAATEMIFELRRELAQTNEKVDIRLSEVSSRKRKRDEEGVHHYFEAFLGDSQRLEAIMAPHNISTLQKWSDKVKAASGAVGSLDANARKFKAVNQSAVAQVEMALRGDGMERLVGRTRVRRTEGKGLGRRQFTLVEESAAQHANGETTGTTTAKEQDPDVFDDTDFYQQLLREVIETRSVDAGHPSLAWATALKQSKRSKKQVDTKASKGRRLRYEVHDKLQNFMVPVPVATWHEDQIDQLFSELGGRAGDGGPRGRRDGNVYGKGPEDVATRFGVDGGGEEGGVDDGWARRADEEVALAGLKVFG